jgi:hypothetical protein
MSAPSRLNPDATVFIPSHPRASSAIADPTTTTVLLAYFSSLRAPLPNVQPSAHSTSTSARTHCRSNQPYHSNFLYQSNHHAAHAAMAEFTSYYGDDPSNVAAWQALLSTCAFDAIPETLDECKEVSIKPLSFHFFPFSFFFYLASIRLRSG